jgi:rubrerythrin
MVAQRVMITDNKIQNNEGAVHEAIRILTKRLAPRQWVCEVCGMLHTGAAPEACDSCGVSVALVQHHHISREMNSHW